VTARLDGDQIEIAVADSGIGLSAEDRTKIFQRFSRVERPEVRRVGGTGLGLYITKNLVELQSGTLQVSSEPDLGSTFTVNLAVADLTVETTGSYLRGENVGRQHAEAVDS
jgi:signal transduction histidine kinase